MRLMKETGMKSKRFGKITIVLCCIAIFAATTWFCIKMNKRKETLTQMPENNVETVYVTKDRILGDNKEDFDTKTLTAEAYFEKNKEDMKLLEAYRQYNSDVYGIIRIEGTKLNHPVMKSDEDADFYLTHDLDKKINSHGVPFIEPKDDFDSENGNTIVYGHRMGDGDVFGELSKYESIDYYKEHPVIETVSERGTARWLIVACCLVCNYDEDAFYYFDNNDFLSLAEYENYMEEIQKRNLLKIPAKLSVEDAYLTLSSCSKEKIGEGTGRIIIMAVRIKNNENYGKTVEESSINPSPLLPEKMR